jgi:O-antigen ligase/Tfp pilus assembly protein PilF
MKSRSRQNPQPAAGQNNAVGPALQRAGLLAAIFLAPLLWGRFDGFGGGVVLTCLCLSSIGLLLSAPKRLLPAGLPLASFHLALAGLLVFSIISSFRSYSPYNSTLDLMRLCAGALLFLLALRAEQQGLEIRGQGPETTTLSASPRPKGKGKSEPTQALTALCFAILAGAGLSSNNWHFYFSTEQVIFLVGFALISVALIAWFLWRKPEAVGPLQVALIAGSLVAAYGIFDWLYMRFAAGNTSWQTFATFFNPNSLAGFLGIALFLSLGALVKPAPEAPPKIGGRLLPIIATLLMLFCLPFTSSKGAYVAIYISGAVFLVALVFIFIRSKTRRLLFIAAILSMMFLLPAALVAARPGLRAKAAESFSLQSRSNMFRYLTWQGTVKMIRAHPWIGVGAGAFEFAFEHYAVGGYTRRAHQNYLETAAETGLPGLACLVWLLLAGIIGLMLAIKRAQHPAGKTLSAAALSALLVMLIHSFFDYDWYIGANCLFFFLACALGFSAAPIPSEDAAGPRKCTLWHFAGMIILLLFIYKAVLVGGSDQAFRAAQELSSKGNTWEAKDRLKTVVKWTPEYGRAHWKLATLSLPNEILPELQKAIALEPEYSPYWNTLGQVREMQGDLRGALQAYEKATTINPQNLNAWLSSAKAKLRANLPKDAAVAYEKLLSVQQSPAGQYPAIDYEVRTEYADAHYGLAAAILQGVAGGGKAAALPHLLAAVKVLDEYAAKGKELDKQRSVLGEGEAGKEQRLNELRARCYFRIAEILQAEGKQAEAAKYRDDAAKINSSIADLISLEDKEWRK